MLDIEYKVRGKRTVGNSYHLHQRFITCDDTDLYRDLNPLPDETPAEHRGGFLYAQLARRLNLVTGLSNVTYRLRYLNAVALNDAL